MDPVLAPTKRVLGQREDCCCGAGSPASAPVTQWKLTRELPGRGLLTCTRRKSQLTIRHSSRGPTCGRSSFPSCA
eukprot:scaffold1068_cov375-Prasinococcus_capsulatus_cf.AAC.2